MQCNNKDNNSNGNNNHNKGKNNNFAVWFFLSYFAIFFGFNCLFQGRIRTNSWLIYFSIKRSNNSKTCKI